ncbi:hypothetical protein GHK78_11775 [Sinorhizobium meliloti]|uniref:hypothetical protein n=1 Tax=Rhizobium meliloti TaxID=382 RepID=UPI0012967D09|nr:hypothetical protein [Sinorhizobium meliloti]MDE3818758.1 hypothetical protein [Sinorhizobium meliloti]MDW9572104.1 hypothetical protein [Sinorhizobium meliloti]MDW9878199.1 hypothetical protein [Sinorhizobium meliloti]MQX63643.1 hypothetical protein [Sinorhizobium meliloti]MQX63710.1 hypothetical protein [Sinorhizobium meliloti]
MVDIAAGLSLAAQAIGIVKDLREIDKGLDSAEYKARMADLYSALADVKMALADAQDEMKSKDQLIAELRDNFQKKGDLVEYHGFKYEKFEDESPKGIPFCPRCEQNLGRYYRLARREGARGDMKCPECKVDYRHIAEFSWEQGR